MPKTLNEAIGELQRAQHELREATADLAAVNRRYDAALTVGDAPPELHEEWETADHRLKAAAHNALTVLDAEPVLTCLTWDTSGGAESFLDRLGVNGRIVLSNLVTAEEIAEARRSGRSFVRGDGFELVYVYDDLVVNDGDDEDLSALRGRSDELKRELDKERAKGKQTKLELARLQKILWSLAHDETAADADTLRDDAKQAIDNPTHPSYQLEAEQLRLGIERLIDDAGESVSQLVEFDSDEIVVKESDLRTLLDRVDAGDSLEFLQSVRSSLLKGKD